MFCNLKGIQEDHQALVDHTVLSSFVAHMVGTYSSSTIKNYVYSVQAWHIIHGAKWKINNNEIDGLCENYAVVTLFFPQIPLFIARPPVLSTTLKGIIMHSRLLRQHVARAYGQDTLYWL